MKAQNINAFSSYQITWVEIRPIQGRKVTLRDQKAFGGAIYLSIERNGYGYARFATKERARAWLKQERKLSKRYEARLFSDKQFGIRKAPLYEVPFTEKQLNDVYFL